ncbi:ceramide kinase [Neocloeon triangulifer]|uniref:ceramide kinase n=1 Tax=Neocloeon triangulifer TaxID=2078957 RepID=UPI00286F3E8E|nr:ceramide kinase [Neocloeon triangulifer]
MAANSSSAGPIDDVVLLNAFFVKGKRCRVYLHRGVLVWETERRPYKRTCVLLSDVLAVHPVHQNVTDSARPCCGENECKEPLSPAMHLAFTIHYTEVCSKNRLRHRLVTLKHSDPRQVSAWIKTLDGYLKSLSNRPKKLLVFVNPYGGKKRGLQIFKKQMEPLLQIAGVACTMVLTEAPNHAFNMLVSVPNLVQTYDGIACVGGDGTFSEVMNGLVTRTCMDLGVDFKNNPDVEPPHPKVAIGVVPGGSTDTVAYCMHGTNDVQTAVLHIILGGQRGMDLCSLRNNEKLLRYTASVISYGYLGDVMKDSENHRWMGPKRYDYSGFKKFFANRGYEGELKIRQKTFHGHHSDVTKGPKCQIHCHECSLNNDNNHGSNGAKDEWKTVSGKFFMVNCANLSCSCPRSPNGIAPFCHVGNGCADIVLVKHTNLFNNLRLLLRLTSSTKTLYDLPFVEALRAQEFCFTAARGKKTSNWNCDGELVFCADMKVKVHRQLVKIFTNSVESSRRSTFGTAPSSNCWC